MFPAARVGDQHSCPIASGPTPAPVPVGPIMPPGGVTVLIGGMPAARMGDPCVCPLSPPAPPETIVMGSVKVLIGGMPAARMLDPTSHGGVVMTGQPTVLIP